MNNIGKVWNKLKTHEKVLIIALLVTGLAMVAAGIERIVVAIGS